MFYFKYMKTDYLNIKMMDSNNFLIPSMKKWQSIKQDTKIKSNNSILETLSFQETLKEVLTAMVGSTPDFV